jgi:hypothetical protein
MAAESARTVYDERSAMSDRFHWARLLAFATGLVNQELLLRNEYLAAENRVLRAHLVPGARARVVELIEGRAVPRTLVGGPRTPASNEPRRRTDCI